MKYEKRYDLIYTNGDSYTAGCGLAQHLYWPDCPDFSENQIIELRKTQDHNNKLLKIKKQFSKKNKDVSIGRKELSLSWPSKLSKLTKTKLMNRARGGKGIPYICIQTIKDLMEIKQNYSLDKICVIIGLTLPARMWWPMRNEEESNTLILNPMMARDDDYELKKSYINHVLTFAKDFDIDIQAILQLMGLQKYCKEKNIDCYFVGTPLCGLQTLDTVNKQFHDFFYSIESNYIDTLGAEVIYEKNIPAYTACYHIIEKYHNTLAERLNEKIEWLC